MKNRTSGYSSDNEPQTSNQTKYQQRHQQQNQQEDLSILRKPILTSLNGFLEAKNAYDNGTEEIRRLLSHECDVMYECKICRNIFRSLTNFISHKRVYCCNNYNNSFDTKRNGFIDQDVSTIIQAEEEYTNRYQANTKTSKKNIISLASNNSSSSSNNNNNNNTNNNNSNNNSHNNNNNNNNNNNQQTSLTNQNDKSNKDLTSIIERLINREQKNRALGLSDFYEQVNLKLTQEEILKKNHTLQFDGIAGSKAAVYQTVIRDEDADSENIKKEINEINDIINCKAILGPDGKLLSTSATNVRATATPTESQVNRKFLLSTNETNGVAVSADLSCDDDLVCQICHIKFGTKKTLKLHIQTKHIPSTYVYQCPSCSQTFLQPAAVIRHLSNDHKKSLRRIRLMRETIFKKHMRIDEVQVKGPSRELARLTQPSILSVSNEQNDAENTRAWMENIERSPRNSPLCSYCGKKFERRAVLTTHLQSCTAKNRHTPTQLLNVVNKKLADTATYSRETTSRSSTSSPSNSNAGSSNATATGIVINSNATSSLLEFAAKSIANASFEPIKPDRVIPKSHQISSSGEFFEIIKPNVTNKLNQNVNKRKRRKPNTILIRKCESVIKQVQQLPNVLNKDVETSDNKIEKLKLSKISVKDVAKKPKLSAGTKLIKEMDKNGNIDVNGFAKPELNQENSENHIKTNSLEKTTKASLDLKIRNKFNRDRFLKQVHLRKNLIFYCRICKKAFEALSNLRRHISMFHYRRRKYGCHMCPYRAFRKYDVVNHLNSAHSLSGQQTLDQILVAEDNFGKDDVDGDIIISDNGELQGEKEEDIEMIRADIAKATNAKNKAHVSKYEKDTSVKGASTIKKGRKPKEPYVIKNLPIKIEPVLLDAPELDVDVLSTEESATKSEKILIEDKDPNELSIVENIDNKSDTETSENVAVVAKTKHENTIGVENLPATITRSDSILSISSNEDRTSSTTSSSTAPTLKRPIRNRVKPVNKDFVYDLSNFLKKDMLCVERDTLSLGKAATKRRNTIVNLDESSRESNSSNSTISSNSSSNLQIVTASPKPKCDSDSRAKPINSSAPIFTQRPVISESIFSSNSSNTKTCSISTMTKPIEKTTVLPSTLLAHLKKETGIPLPAPLDAAQKHKILSMTTNGIDKSSPNFTNIFKSFEDLKKVKHVRRTSDDAVIRLLNKKRKSVDISDLTSMSDSAVPLQSPIEQKNKTPVIVNGTGTQTIFTAGVGIGANDVGGCELSKSKSKTSSTESLSFANRDAEIFTKVPNDLKRMSNTIKSLHLPPADKQQNDSVELNSPAVAAIQTVSILSTNEIKYPPTEKEFQEYLRTNNLSEPVKKIDISAVLAEQEKAINQAGASKDQLSEQQLQQQSSLLVSGKRITLLQRLAENKNKKIQESLLRNALEN